MAYKSAFLYWFNFSLFGELAWSFAYNNEIQLFQIQMRRSSKLFPPCIVNYTNNSNEN